MAEGFFRRKKGFTVVQNEITKDNKISLKAKGLYLVIQAYITMPDKKWTKEDFLNMAKEGRKAFETAWQELKDTGYLKVHFVPVSGKWQAEYELLDEPDSGPHTLYYNGDGEITSDNVQRAEKKSQSVKADATEKKAVSEEIRQADKEPDTDIEDNFSSGEEVESRETTKMRYPQNGGNGSKVPETAKMRYPHFGSNGNSSNGNGINANGGNNNKDFIINPDNNALVSNPNQYHGNELPHEKYPMSYLESLYHAHDMILMGVDGKDVEMVMEILYDAVNTSKPIIRVNREDKPAGVVQSRLLKLECMDIIYAIEQYHKQTTEIHYQKAYMLSILYEAKGQGHLDYANQVQHDFYGSG